METLLEQKRAYQRQLKNLQQSAAFNRHQQRELNMKLCLYDMHAHDGN